MMPESGTNQICMTDEPEIGAPDFWSLIHGASLWLVCHPP